MRKHKSELWFVSASGCMLGLKDGISLKVVAKKYGSLTNSLVIVEALQRKCDDNHEHDDDHDSNVNDDDNNENSNTDDGDDANRDDDECDDNYYIGDFHEGSSSM